MTPFQQAFHKILPQLEEIQNGLLPLPTTSQATLLELQQAACDFGMQNKECGIKNEAVLQHVPIHSETQNPKSYDSLDALREAALVCTRCPHLAATRTQVVFGVGNPQAELMFVGEAPGADEDAQGIPFVGRAGQLFTKIIEAMGFSRQDVYIGNVLKCRPDMPCGVTGNRKPRPEEMATCLPWLAEQIKIIQPKVLVAVGATSAEGLLGITRPMREIRGKWFAYQNIPVIVTYHPAYLLRNQTITEKRKVWEDMLQVLERLEKPISEKQQRYFLSSSS